METFTKLFERFLIFVYHCFDRIVIQGYLPLLTRPEHIVHFFRDVHGQYPITPEVLAKRTAEYRGWVQGYARNHKVPITEAKKGVIVNLLHEFNAGQYPSRIVELLEAEHRLYPEFYAPMVLFDDVVQVRTGANLHRVFPAEIELVAHSH